MPSSWACATAMPVSEASAIAATIQRRFMTFPAIGDATKDRLPAAAQSGATPCASFRCAGSTRYLVAGGALDVQRSPTSLAQAGVDFVQHGGAGTQRFLAELIERRFHSVAGGVQVFRFRIDVQESGDDLALGGVLLQECHRCDAIVGVIIRVHLARRQPP